MEKILKYIVIAGIFVLPFLTLLVMNSLFFPYITGKNFAFRFITEIIFFAWIALAFINKEYRPKWNWILGAFGAFILIMLFADIFSQFPYKSFWSNYERMEGFVTIAHLFAYFVVAISVLKNKLWPRLIDTWLVASVIISMQGLLQFFGAARMSDGVRLDATFGNPAYLASFMLFSIFFAILRAVQAETKTRRNIYIALAGLNLFILYYTATRGAILGLLAGAGLLTVLIGFFERESLKLKKVAMVMLGLMLFSSGLFIAMRNTDVIQNNRVLSRFANISLTEHTSKSRLMVWNMAIQGFKERPILGWGQESFNYVFNKYYDPKMYEQEQWFDRTHNVLFDWLIAGGILGLLSYLAIFGTALSYLWRRSNFHFRERAVLTALLFGYFFQNLFVFDNLISYLAFFTIIAYIFSGSQSKLVWQKEYSVIAKQFIASAALIAFFMTAYLVNAGGYYQGKALLQALAWRGTDVNESLILFKKAISYNSFGTPEVREHLSERAVGVKNSNAPDAAKQEFLSFTLEEMLRQVQRTPEDARYVSFTGSYLNNIGLHEEALKYFERAQELSPRKQSFYFGRGATLMAMDRKEESLEVLREAYELEPRYDEAKMMYALALIYNKKFEEAEEMLAKVTEGRLDKRIVRAYYDVGNSERAIVYARKLIEQNPVSENYVTLSVLLAELGRKSEAIEVLREAIATDPMFKSQGEKFMEEIQERY
jgi:O-antigen ligase